MTSMLLATAAIAQLHGFIPYNQAKVIGSFFRGEEGDFYRTKIVEYARLVSLMPHTYEQDGKGDDAMAYLHYFSGSCDWYITEKDMEDEQNQAFGWADLGYGGELGYISLVQLCGSNVELDLHWTPRRLREIKAA